MVSLFLQFMLSFLLGHTMGVRYIGPVGPRMCASLCRSTYGCSLYVFSRANLTCQLVNDHYTWEGSAMAMENTQLQDEASSRANQPCSMFSTIFHDRGGKICCMKQTNDVSYSAETLRSRMLVTNVAQKQMIVHQIFMDDFSRKIYPNLILKRVEAMMYFPPSRSLIVSQPSLGRLRAISVDTNIVRTIKDGIKCRSMAIDNQRNLLLMAVAHPKPAIYTAAGSGRNCSLLFHFNMTDQDRALEAYPSSIVMDSRRNLVYICLSKKIIAVDFTGKTKELLKGKALNGLSFNAQDDVLYYASNTVIMRLSLNTKRARQVKDLGIWTRDVVFYKDYIHAYSSYFFSSTPTTNTNKPFRWKLPLSGTWILSALP